MNAALPTMFTDYLLNPASPLVFGTGKPLDSGLGGDCLDFPYPPTLAGALRAAHASKTGNADPFSETVKAPPLAWATLARVGQSRVELAFPMPADAVYFGGVPRRVVLPDGAIAVGAHNPLVTDLELPNTEHDPNSPYLGLRLPTLSPGAGDTSDLSKPDNDAPRWWSTSTMDAWLSGNEMSPSQARGLMGPQTARRTHVVIDPQTGGADPGGLFRSSALDFSASFSSEGDDASEYAGEYAIAARFASDSLSGLSRRVGGEGRFAKIEQSNFDALLPKAPDLVGAGHLIRFVLLTPALFPCGGWSPTGIANVPFEVNNVLCSVVGVALSRAQMFSGWQTGGRPGTPYRIVPAGTVYWLQVECGNPLELHLQSLCAPEQARDGWGVGAVGINVGSVPHVPVVK